MAFEVGRRSRKGIAPSLNVTPLVDVVLVLLIIFMVVTPMLTREISVQLPQDAQAAAPQNAAPSRRLLLKSDYQLFLDQTPVSKEEILALLNSDKTVNVFFDAEEQVPYEQVISTMDALRPSGGSRIILSPGMGAVTSNSEPR